MYKIKDIAKRGVALLGAAGLMVGIGTSALPALVSANSLNPLTKRSLTLSSSSPGWAYTDGSGNSTYAPPNSGANGQKTGNMFAFHNSTANGGVKTMSFQYCTTSAGLCTAPGDDVNGAGTGTITVTSASTAVTGTGTAFTTQEPAGTEITTVGGHIYTVASVTDDTHLTLTANAAATETSVTFSYRDADSVTNQQSDLNVVTSSPAEVSNTNFSTVINTSTGAVSGVPGATNPLNPSDTTGQYVAHNVTGNFLVMHYNGTAWVQDTGWSMSVANAENGTGALTGRNNYIILANSTALNVPFDTPIQVIFFGTNNNYITNPGAGAFFVKIDTYNVKYDGSTVTLNNLEPASQTNVVDGGVTVANVMNQSIQITTKVLETMQFSVGTVDPDTLTDAQLLASDNGSSNHQPCDTILTRMTPSNSADVLQLGNQTAESSLSTTNTYATHSYWRLSSNSSAGATIYYSGHTLSDTEGDQITPIGATAKQSAPGSEQFGLALDTVALTGGHGFDDATYGVNYNDAAGSFENGADGNPTAIDNSVLTNLGAVNTPPWDYTNLNKSFHMPRLDPLVPKTAYGSGDGTITNGGTAQFAFDPNSDTIPAAIATESSSVVDCVTGKMRYIANIAATTPAGIYTTKVNYIAAPQY